MQLHPLLERAEEFVLLLVAVVFLLLLAPLSLPVTLGLTLLIAVALIVILMLRSYGWHSDRITPYDWVVIAGAFLTLAYLSTFLAFVRTMLGVIVIVLFALFYAILAVLLMRHRGWLFGDGKNNDDINDMHYAHVKRYKIVRKDAREHQEHQAATSAQDLPARRRFSFFRRKRDAEFKRGLEPIPEVAANDPKEERFFKRGMEPIPPMREVTAEHLHRMGVYETESPRLSPSKVARR